MQRHLPTVLVVDADSAESRALVAALRGRGMTVLAAHDGESALNAIDKLGALEGLVVALSGPRLDGVRVFEHARAAHADVCAIVLVDGGQLDRGVQAMRAGAASAEVRPAHAGKVAALLERGFAQQAMAQRVEEMHAELSGRGGVAGLRVGSPAIQRVVDQISHVAATRTPVLIEGESGTGKGVIARTIHFSGPRRHERFVWMACAALAGEAQVAELFGDERAGEGAPRPGRFELADGGTLFLDDVTQLAPEAQLPLLRAVQDRVFERVGGTTTRRADVRLIASSPVPLEAEVAAGRFREDLARRLSAVRVHVPPLRERLDDLPVLVQALVREFSRAHGRRVAGVTRGVLERLRDHAWPGNVRELKNVVEDMVLVTPPRQPIDLAALPERLRGDPGREERVTWGPGTTVEEAERDLVAATLRHTGGDKPRAAAMLGMGLRTLYRKIERWGLEPR